MMNEADVRRLAEIRKRIARWPAALITGDEGALERDCLFLDRLLQESEAEVARLKASMATIPPSLLENPPEPSDNLRRLLTAPAPWDASEIDRVSDAICGALAPWLDAPLNKDAYDAAARAAKGEIAASNAPRHDRVVGTGPRRQKKRGRRSGPKV